MHPPAAGRAIAYGPSGLSLPREALPYLHISRFRLADSGETLDFGSFPALGDAQGAVWCKSLFRLIFRNLCRYGSREAGEGRRAKRAGVGDPTRPASLRSHSRRFASAFLVPRTAAEGRLCHPPLRGGIRRPIQPRICDRPAAAEVMAAEVMAAGAVRQNRE